MRTAELTGALLDYWVGVAANRVPRIAADGTCVIDFPPDPIIGAGDFASYNPSTSWYWGGPLIEKYDIAVLQDGGVWYAGPPFGAEFYAGNAESGPTPLVAICRAVVRSAFGDEVPEC